MSLTDTHVKQVKWSGKAAGDKHADGGGMYLLVKEAGKYWRMDYRHLDKRKTLALGVYLANAARRTVNCWLMARIPAQPSRMRDRPSLPKLQTHLRW